MSPEDRTQRTAPRGKIAEVRQVENVEPTPLEPAVAPPKAKSPYRSVSVAGWGFVLFAFLVNRKLGVVVFLMMLLLVVFPQLTSSSVARGAGKTWKKIRGFRRN